MANLKQEDSSSTWADLKPALWLFFMWQVYLLIPMAIVYMAGPDGFIAQLLVYAPVCLMFSMGARQNYSPLFLASLVLCMVHSWTHEIYPFLDKHTGANPAVSVWQDLICHFLQFMLFCLAWWPRASMRSKVLLVLFGMGVIGTVPYGYVCWGEGSMCIEGYRKSSVFSGLASSMHCIHPMMYKRTEGTNAQLSMLCLILTYINWALLKNSLWFTATMCECRFFDLYFSAPHLVGFLNAWPKDGKKHSTDGGVCQTYMCDGHEAAKKMD